MASNNIPGLEEHEDKITMSVRVTRELEAAIDSVELRLKDAGGKLRLNPSAVFEDAMRKTIKQIETYLAKQSPAPKKQNPANQTPTLPTHGGFDTTRMS